ncbi:hydroxyacid dehydrogenase, partial [Streptomyces albiflaviniger]|nr:hydroxyacid dehydrogenase [Streptomyces albiflaviniger]
MPTTLITTPTFARHSARPWQILEEAGAGPLRPREDTALPTAELLSHAAEADALIVGMDPITAEVMDAAPGSYTHLT